MNFDFTGKTVIVTGGTSGLGYGISRSFVNAGANAVTNIATLPDQIKQAKYKFVDNLVDYLINCFENRI